MLKSGADNQLLHLALVICSAICIGLLLTVSLVYFHGPSGKYVLGNVVLAPEVLDKLNYNDKNPKTGQSDRFVFDHIEFTWYEDEVKEWKKLQVDKEKYATFYNAYRDQSSLLDPSEDILALFKGPFNASIALKVKTESSSSWQADSKDFQEIQFVFQGNYFRVKLHEQNPGDHWVYFYHPHIYHDVLGLMIP